MMPGLAAERRRCYHHNRRSSVVIQVDPRHQHECRCLVEGRLARSQAPPEKDAVVVITVDGRQSSSLSTSGPGMSAACRIGGETH